MSLGHAVTVLGGLPGNENIVSSDLETELCRFKRTETEMVAHGRAPAPTGPPYTPQQVIITLPKETVCKLARDVASQVCLPALARGAGLRILTCKLAYYSVRRNEFYSPLREFDFKSGATGFAPSTITVLIDDVYDMLYRLSRPGALFAGGRKAPLPATPAKEERVPSNDSSPRDEFVSRIRDRINVLRTLLNWRQRTITAAEGYAAGLGAEFLVWAAKQSARSLNAWMHDPQITRVYLSHPISRPRRLQRVAPAHGGAPPPWDSSVEQFNRLQSLLADRGVLAVMPTGIDEWRVCRDRLAEDGEWIGDLRLPQLGARWPLPDASSPLLWDPCPDDPSGTLSDVLASESLERLPPGAAGTTAPPDAEGKERPSGRVGAMLSLLEDMLQEQLAARDFLFVSICPHILVFRPLSKGDPYSSGVTEEIRLWTDLAAADHLRRIGLLHLQEDVDAYRQQTESHAERRTLREEALTEWKKEQLADRLNLTGDAPSEILRESGRLAGRGPLDGSGPFTGADFAAARAIVAEAATAGTDAWIEDTLTAETIGVSRLLVPDARVNDTRFRYWLLPGAGELEEAADVIAGWFKTGQVPGS